MSRTSHGGRRKAPKKGASAAGAAAPRTWKQRLGRFMKWATVSGLVLVLIAGVAFVVAYKTIDIPDPNEDFQTETTHVYYQDGETEVGTFAEQNRTSVALDEMSGFIKDAVVAAENRSFWSDSGLDPKGILRAAFSNLSSETTQGASTITQQYVKILYLTQEQTYTRKIKEAILSLKIHNQLSKEEILEGYLNTIYFGRGAYGIEEAAEAYFGTSAKKLNLRQSAVLASVLNNPYSMDPANGKEARERLRSRFRWVIDSMVEMNVVKPQRAEKASKRMPRFHKQETDNRLGGQTGHTLSLVKGQLQQLGFSPEQIESGGLKVTTTLTRKVMRAARQGVREARPDVPAPKQLHAAVASVQPSTGALRGFYGGHNYLQSQINWAATGGMAGSVMKPAAAVAALKSGFELKDSFDGNSPYTEPSGALVQNSGQSASLPYGHSYGQVSMIEAMQDSVNTAFIDMTHGMGEKGPKKIYQAGLDMGIPPPKADEDHPGIPMQTGDFAKDDTRISLGRAVTSPINMANAYATIANDGVQNDVYVIDKVTDASGEVLYEHEKNPERAMSSGIAADVSYTLQQTADAGTGSANASSAHLGRPTAGKTGTATKEDSDGGTYVSSSWYVGYTPEMSTAVMYVRGDGNDRLDDWMPSYYGATYPATTFTAVMTRALEGREVSEFPPPAWVTGEAPSDGYEPAPEPEPTPETEPEPEPSKEPSKSPSPTQTPTPSETDESSRPPKETETETEEPTSPGETESNTEKPSSSPTTTPSESPPGLLD